MRAALLRTIEESDGLIQVFDALLMIARAEAGADRSSLARVDMSEVVDSVAELYEPLAEEKGFVFHVDCEPGLAIEGRRELIGQALANLLDNALKYGALGRRRACRGEISVGARREGGEIVIEVADRGPGVAPRIASACSTVSCAWRARARGRAPGSGCRWWRRRRGCMAATVRLEDNAPGLKVAAQPAGLAAVSGPLKPPRRVSRARRSRRGSKGRRRRTPRFCAAHRATTRPI